MSLEEDAEALAEMQVSLMREYRTESVMVSLGVSNHSSFEEHFLPVTNNLLEQVVARDNMLLAYERVCANKGAPGIDNRSVYDLKGYLQKHWTRIKGELFSKISTVRNMFATQLTPYLQHWPRWGCRVEEIHIESAAIWPLSATTPPSWNTKPTTEVTLCRIFPNSEACC